MTLNVTQHNRTKKERNQRLLDQWRQKHQSLLAADELHRKCGIGAVIQLEHIQGCVRGPTAAPGWSQLTHSQATVRVSV